MQHSTGGTVLKEILGNAWYWLLGIFMFGAVLLFAIWLPNLTFLRHVAVSPDYALAQKVSLFFASLSALSTNFSTLSRTVTIIVAVLFAVNTVLTVFYFRRRAALQREAGLSVAGGLAGFLGIGCAACGSVILTSIFGIGATAAALNALPLRGQEFGLLSIAVLGASILLTVKKIDRQLVCSSVDAQPELLDTQHAHRGAAQGRRRLPPMPGV